MGKIADFWIGLGLRGTEDSQRKLDKQNDSFKDLKKTSTEAKLAILAMLYGVEQMVTTYGAAGQELLNFNTLTGISLTKLQAYENQAQRVGAANGELTKTFDELQKQMFGVMTGQGVPPWLATVTGTLQGMGVKFSPAEQANTAQAWGQNPDLMFQRINQFAQNQVLDQWKTANVLRQMGFADTIIAGMMKHFFDPKALAQGASTALTDDTVKQLAVLNQEWVGMGQGMKQFFATLSGSDLPGFVKDLAGIAHALERIGYDLDALGHKMGLFKGFNGLASSLEVTLGGIDKYLRAKNDKEANEATIEAFGFRRAKGGLFGTNTVNHFHTEVHVIAEGGKKLERSLLGEFNDVMKGIASLYAAKASH